MTLVEKHSKVKTTGEQMRQVWVTEKQLIDYHKDEDIAKAIIAQKDPDKKRINHLTKIQKQLTYKDPQVSRAL